MVQHQQPSEDMPAGMEVKRQDPGFLGLEESSEETARLLGMLRLMKERVGLKQAIWGCCLQVEQGCTSSAGTSQASWGVAYWQDKAELPQLAPRRK